MAVITPTDILVNDAISSSVQLERLSVSMRRKVKAILKKTQQEVIAEAVKIDPFAVSSLTGKQNRIAKLNKEINRVLKNNYNNIKKSTQKQLESLSGLVGKSRVSSINNAIGADLFSVNLSKNKLKSLVDNTMVDGNVIGDWWTSQRNSTARGMKRTLNSIAGQVQVGVIKGDPITEMVRRIRGTANVPGVFTGSINQAESLVHTSVMQVNNGMAFNVYEENKDLVKGFQILATLDSRTTPLCRAYDHQTYTLDYKPIPPTTRAYPKQGGPPFHWRCRTTTVPIVKKFSELKENLPDSKLKNLDEMPVGKRAALGKPVSGDMDYNQWLITQPKDVQVEALGPTRWKMWNQGQSFSMSDMINQNNRPLTIKQLEVLIKKKTDKAVKEISRVIINAT